MKLLLLLLLTISLSACGTAQKIKYSTLEQIGIHKRDILVDRIEETTQTQEQAKQQFKTAYEKLVGLVGANDSDLEKKYIRMAKAVEASENKSNELDRRIKSVDQVAKALFSEWRDELQQYTNESLRRTSQQNLKATEKRYAELYATMQSSQQRIKPVLETLQDNTLYLKHNLNARAVLGISSEVIKVENKVAFLILQMEESIAESSRFINDMQLIK